MKNVSMGLVISFFVHGAMVSGLYTWSAVHTVPIVAELDFSVAAMGSVAANMGDVKITPVPVEEKTALKPVTKKETALVPMPSMPKVEEAEKVKEKSESVKKAALETSTTTGRFGAAERTSFVGRFGAAERTSFVGRFGAAERTSFVGEGSVPNPEKGLCDSGTGEVMGFYVPSSEAVRNPKLLKNFISDRDYPALAREARKNGRVVLSVLINEKGRVQDARLLQGADEALNEVALRKVWGAVFTPAYNAEGKAVATWVALPIRFKLK
jgi:TonB family protein